MKKLFAVATFASVAVVVPMASPAHAAAAPLPLISGFAKTESANYIAGLAAKNDGTVLYVEETKGIRKVSAAGTVTTIATGNSGQRAYTSAFVSGGGVFVSSNSGVFSSPLDDGNIVYKESTGAGLFTGAAADAALGLNNESAPAWLYGIMTTPSGKVYASTQSWTESTCLTKLYKMNASYAFEFVRQGTRNLVTVGDGEDTWQSSENCISASGAVDESGNVYDIDYSGEGYKIKKWTSNDSYDVIAGTGVRGNGRHGDGGKATDANLGYVSYLTPDTQGNLYFYERGYIRRISSTGILTTVAGKGTHWDNEADPESWRNYSGDGKAAINAELGGVMAMTTSPAGDLYFSTAKKVGEKVTYLIRKIDMNPVLPANAGTQIAIPKKPSTKHSTDVEIAINGVKVTVGLKTPAKAPGSAGAKKEIIKYTITLVPTKRGVATVTKSVDTSSRKAVKVLLNGARRASYNVSITAIARNGTRSEWTSQKITL